MWKGTAVIAGRCGGLKHQIEDGVNGFTVTSVEAAAQRIVQLIEDSALRKKFGARARDTVRERFLLTRKIEQYLDLFAAFEPRCAPNHGRLAALGAGTAGRAR
jgi:trehalose synthase